ncbi:MAG: GTPase HflX [Rhodospirillaceae bacterium]|nr:GTPase HflX [Rhodospirillaceae bacterium]
MWKVTAIISSRLKSDLTDSQGGSDVRRTRAVVIHPFQKPARSSRRAVGACLEEAVGLAAAINLNVVSEEAISLSKINAGTYFGKGTVERIGGFVELEDIDIVCVDTSLSPVQQRTLEKAWHTKVIDRTGIILEIFGARARTREGVLQVELAHLNYQRSRLVRTWTHLERQRGGFGFLGGPGETQIEADRRMISGRISKIQRDLQTVTRTRKLHREARRRIPCPVIALVGYTNAGKSTLFNKVTAANVFAKDLLFATLDPTMRAINLPSSRSAVLSDTVGFVSDLPTTLIAAFRATLEEVISADIIVHVRDISHPDTEAQKADVLRVMKELGIVFGQGRRFVEVLNKIDLLNPDMQAAVFNQASREDHMVAMSALKGSENDIFLDCLDGLLSSDRQVAKFKLSQGNGAAISWLYRHADVLGRDDRGVFAHIEVSIAPEELARFKKITRTT